jgi:lysyl-tRNA synthetase class 2
VKRRTKQREAEKKKAEKAKTLPVQTKAKAKELSEDDLNPNVRGRTGAD